MQLWLLFLAGVTIFAVFLLAWRVTGIRHASPLQLATLLLALAVVLRVVPEIVAELRAVATSAGTPTANGRP